MTKKQFKVGDIAHSLNGGKVESGIIVDIFKDEPYDEAGYTEKCCYTSNNGGLTKSFHRIKDLFEENEIRLAEDAYKSRYDDEVDPGHMYH